MENPHDAPPPCESRESDGPSEPMELDEPNRFDFGVDGPQAGELEADELEQNNGFDGGESAFDMSALKVGGLDFRKVFETEADDPEEDESESENSETEDSEADESVPSSDLVPQIRPRRRDVYSVRTNNPVYTTYVPSGELVIGKRRGPDGHLTIKISQLYMRSSTVYPRILFERRHTERGLIIQQAYPTVKLYGGFLSKFVNTKITPRYSLDEDGIFFVQERMVGVLWRSGS
ncbi:uncharacterized protein Triagg1_4081 [Trichoderma aggressivum f. europaeum]|uniref:Uncharacterized protein n=1 Tax=Trichoderma aggressivum f. europaeum TaxID=173218 RepID=A0AAE1M6G8_9HYPO|nr:hypothetical protein Triagg1_4081 [Trichoderma aggressivum f. europaeum]